MKIIIDFEDGQPQEIVMQISKVHENILKNEICPESFKYDIKRRLQWVIESKVHACRSRLVNKWLNLIKEKYDSIPSNDDSLSELILIQKEYTPDYVKKEEVNNVIA